MGFVSSIIDRVRYGKANALVSSGRAYDAGRYDTREMLSWTPNLTSGVDEVLDSRDLVVRRSRDLVRNHPIIAGATDRRAESVVGTNIRPELQPAFEIMGQDPDWADEWSSNTEDHFELWSRDPRFLCDAEMQLQFGGMVEMAYRHWWNDGECAVMIKMLPPTGPRVGALWETCLHVIDPDRISNPRNLPDYTVTSRGRTLIGGSSTTATTRPSLLMSASLTRGTHWRPHEPVRVAAGALLRADRKADFCSCLPPQARRPAPRHQSVRCSDQADQDVRPLRRCRDRGGSAQRGHGRLD